MPTPDMSDEELDELVRRSAEAYPEELPLGNWLRMEEKLQKAATERLVRQRVWRFFELEVAVVALLLLLWQGYRAVSPNPEVPQNSISKTTTETSSPISYPTSATPTSPRPKSIISDALASVTARTGTAPGVGTTSQKSADSPTKPVQLAATSSALPTGLKPPSVFLGQPVTVFRSKRRTTTGTTAEPVRYALLSGQVTAQPIIRPTPPEGGEVTASGSALDEAVGGNNWKLLATQPQDLGQHFPLPLVLPLPRQDTLARAPSAQLAPTDSAEQHQEPLAVPFYRVVVGVLGAPAWSAVRTLGTAQLGGDLGLTLEYRLASRLRVRSGLIRSVKRYAAASSDYTPLPAWNWRPGTYEVYANCRITEIPLDLRYDVVSKPTYNLFASAGLTSLLMRHERYAYDYQVNGQTRTAGAKVVNGSNYAFGLFTASLGMERPLSTRWSGQVEPFLQLPLGQVGAGKVRLSSAGVSFSLKYGLLR